MQRLDRMERERGGKMPLGGTGTLTSSLVVDGGGAYSLTLQDLLNLTAVATGNIALEAAGDISLDATTTFKLYTPGLHAGVDDFTDAVLKLTDDSNGQADWVASGSFLLKLSGGTMSGPIAMGAQKITGLLAGTVGTDAVNKTQTDALLTNPVLTGNGAITVPQGTTAQRPTPTEGMIRYNSTTGNMESYGAGAWRVWLRQDGSIPMTGALAMGSQKITGLGTPTVSTDAATMGYVDRRSANATGTGLDFDGGATAIGTSTSVTSYNVGTGDVSVWVRARIAETGGVSRTIFALTSNSSDAPIQINCLIGYLTSAGALTVSLYGTTSIAYRRTATIASFATTYAGTTVDLVVTRQANVVKIYVNGVDTAYTETTAGSPTIAWDESITSTFLRCGTAHSGSFSSYNSTIYRCAVFNRALALADVASLIVEGVSYGDRWASTSALYSADFAASITGWSAASANTTLANVAGRLQITWPTSGAAGGAILDTPLLASGRNYRVTFIHRLASGSFTDAQVRESGSTVGWTTLGGHVLPFTPTGSDQTNITDITQVSVVSGSRKLYIFGTPSASGTIMEIDNVSITRIGAFVDYNFDAGVGYQQHDSSDNKLNATIASTTSWKSPSIRGRVSDTLTVNTGQQMLATLAIPTDAHIQNVIVENVNVGSGATFSLGTAAAGTTLLNAVPLGGTGTKSVYEPAVSGSSTGNLHAFWSAAGTVKVTIIYTITI